MVSKKKTDEELMRLICQNRLGEHGLSRPKKTEYEKMVDRHTKKICRKIKTQKKGMKK
jgi:hypothetical protein